MKVPSRVFRRVQAEGWLVLAGSLPASDEASPWIESLLTHAAPARPVLWLEAEAEAIEPSEFLNEVEEQVEAPVRVAHVDDPEWENAGLLMVSEGVEVERLALPEVSGRLLACLQSGGTLAAFGSSTAVFGEAFMADPGGPRQGLGWLAASIILPEPIPAADDPAIRAWLRSPEKRLALRLPRASVLALGPDGEVEVWGGAQPGLTLGPAWSRE